MTSATKSTSLTLVGRVSSIGTAEQEFAITCRLPHGLVRAFRCECRSARSREAFAAIVDGDLIGIIAKIATGTNGDRSLLLVDRLERLGGPRP
jgi:hypothetical protein